MVPFAMFSSGFLQFSLVCPTNCVVPSSILLFGALALCGCFWLSCGLGGITNFSPLPNLSCHYVGVFNKIVSLGRDGSLRVNTAYVDNLWKLMKAAPFGTLCYVFRSFPYFFAPGRWNLIFFMHIRFLVKNCIWSPQEMSRILTCSPKMTKFGPAIVDLAL